jgi:hypothetical protein
VLAQMCVIAVVFAIDIALIHAVAGYLFIHMKVN